MSGPRGRLIVVAVALSLTGCLAYWTAESCRDRAVARSDDRDVQDKAFTDCIEGRKDRRPAPR